MVYSSKQDRRLLLALVAISLVPIGLGGYFFLGGDIVPGLLFLGAGVFVSWVFLVIRYEITATELLLRYGPFQRRVPLPDILEVFPIRAAEQGPNGPTDHLRINYQRQMTVTFVLLAPRDPEGFLRELAERTPGLKVTKEQGERE